MNSEEVREVCQFHFTSCWTLVSPVTPLPCSTSCGGSITLTPTVPYSNKKPILIHCSAGVDRTGSLITIDVELQRERQKQVVDSFNYVLQMRDKCNHMVQTEVIIKHHCA